MTWTWAGRAQGNLVEAMAKGQPIVPGGGDTMRGPYPKRGVLRGGDTVEEEWGGAVRVLGRDRGGDIFE